MPAYRSNVVLDTEPDYEKYMYFLKGKGRATMKLYRVSRGRKVQKRLEDTGLVRKPGFLYYVKNTRSGLRVYASKMKNCTARGKPW